MPKSTRDTVLGERFMGLFIGPNGSGKTSAASSWYKKGPILFCDFDGRMDSVKVCYPDADVNYDTFGPRRIPEREIKDLNDFDALLSSLMKSCPYKTLVIDSLTSFSTTCITYQMALKGIGNKVNKGGMAVPSWDEFNGEAMTGTQMLDVLKILPCDVILTAHPVSKIKIDATGNSSAVFESLVSFGIKLPSLVPGYFNEIFYFESDPSALDPKTGKKVGKRIVRTRPYPGIPAKSTLPIPETIELSDFGPGLYDVIQSYLVPKT